MQVNTFYGQGKSRCGLLLGIEGGRRGLGLWHMRLNGQVTVPTSTGWECFGVGTKVLANWAGIYQYVVISLSSDQQLTKEGYSRWHKAQAIPAIL